MTKPKIVWRVERVVDLFKTGRLHRQYRLEHGIRQADLARAMGVHKVKVCDLEHGRQRWTEPISKQYLGAMQGLLFERVRREDHARGRTQ